MENQEIKTTFPKEDNALTRTVYAYVNGKISDKELIRSIKEMSDEYPYNKNNLKPFSLELAKQGKPDLAQFTPRQLIEELKNRGYTGELQYVQKIKL